MREFAPHMLCARVNAMHLFVVVLQPTACARSHCSCAVHMSSTLPWVGAMHFDWPAGQTCPALHELRTQAPPTVVGGWHTPHAASGARAQKVLAHWASSAHAPSTATVPGSVLQDAPKSPFRNASQPSEASDCPHAAVFVGVALVPGAVKAGTQLNTMRFSQVASSP